MEELHTVCLTCPNALQLNQTDLLFSFSKHIDQGVTEQCSNSLLDSWDNRPRLPSTFQRVYQESHIHAHTTDFVPATFWVLTKPFFSNREEFNFWAIHLLV